MSKNDKVIWITGASSGIGKEIALEFARNGEHVLATSRSIISMTSIEKVLGDKSKNFIPYQLDITNLNQIQKFYDAVSAKHKIVCLINNAGLTSFKKVDQDTIDEIEKIISTNLLGSIYSIKTVLPQMINSNSGTIINLLSVVTQKIFNNSSAYSASKSGLLAYTKVLREEVRGNNIRVINVSPGATQTPIWPNSALEKYSYRMMSPKDLAKLIYQLYTLKGNLVTEEVIIRPLQGDI